MRFCCETRLFLSSALNSAVHRRKLLNSRLDRPKPIIAEADSPCLLGNAFGLEDLAGRNVEKDNVKAARVLNLDEPVHEKDKSDAFLVFEPLGANASGD